MARILVMDDHPLFLGVVEAFVRSAGHQTLTACDGIAGLLRMSEGGVDAIVADIEMPWMTGIAVCEAVRANPEWRSVPIILMTGRPAAAITARALEAGASGVLSKPFQFEELRGLLLRFLPASRIVSP